MYTLSDDLMGVFEEMKKVLVVDDSETVLDMARDALERNGYEVLTALSAKEADTFIFGEMKPDVIVMDVMLPVLDGDKKTRMLKENEAVRHIPILLLSSKPEQELLYLVAESGADGFIRKPFVPRQLIEQIENVMAGQQTRTIR
jgi:CheY-like chemotaxis protein